MEDPRQYVAVDGSTSTKSLAISGVPQGTVLGSLLFLVFTSNIIEGLLNSTASFADDRSIIKPMCCVHDCEALQIAEGSWANL